MIFYFKYKKLLKERMQLLDRIQFLEMNNKKVKENLNHISDSLLREKDRSKGRVHALDKYEKFAHAFRDFVVKRAKKFAYFGVYGLDDSVSKMMEKTPKTDYSFVIKKHKYGYRFTITGKNQVRIAQSQYYKNKWNCTNAIKKLMLSLGALYEPDIIDRTKK